jgi:hypothetical protein
MFGHLKAEDFMNLMEGAPLAGKGRAHLESCARCAETLKSVEAVRNQVTAMQMTVDEHVPEPDWADFRADVRNTLLSRSVKRQSANRSWLGGLNLRPAAAWGFSMVLVFGLMTSVVLWNQNTMEPTEVQNVSASDVTGTSSFNAIAGMTQADVFDDLLQLNESEAENLKRLVEDMTQKSAGPQ